MSTRPQHQDWQAAYRGEDIVQPFQTDPATDITSWTIVCQMKDVDAAGLPTGTVLATGTVTKTAPLTGAYEVKFTSAQTDRAPKKYFVDVWRFEAGTKKVFNEGFLPIVPYETQF